MAISFVSTPVKLLLPAVPLIALAVAAITSHDTPARDDAPMSCLGQKAPPPAPPSPCGPTGQGCTAPAPA